jgi:two-component system, LytTR family, response regulator
MFKAIIIDDEAHCRRTLEILLKEYCPDVHLLESCNSAMAGIAAIKKHMPDLVFLDIEMPHMNGFEMLDQLHGINAQIVFTTSYDQYAIKAFRVSALDYLLKPITKEDLIQTIDKLKRNFQHPVPQQLEVLFQKILQPSSLVQKIALPTMEGLRMVEVSSIISCSSESNYTAFFLKKGEKLVVSRTMKEMEEILLDYSFLRVHNSFLVNLNEIEKYMKGDGGYLLMSDGSTVGVSRNKKDDLLNRLKISKH